MSTFYRISFGAVPQIDSWFGMGLHEAYDFVENGGDVWTRYGSDARDLAAMFPDYYKDVIHFETRNRPGEKYTMEHFHPTHTRGHAHICFGEAVNDHNSYDILRLD